MVKRSLIALALALLLTALSGCAPLSLSPAPTIGYQCEGGHEFRLTVAPSGDSATIEISEMKFNLQAESPRGAGERYGCGVLTLWREGDLAWVDVEGAQQFTNCRPSSSP